MVRLLRAILMACIIAFCSENVSAQMPLWAFNIGSTGDDMGFVCKAAPNGNVYLAGKFTGTMDLDPGPGVHNVTSNGLDDIFLACYTSSGAFLWGFNIGGSDYDAVDFMTVDSSSNVYITGYFRGYPTVDFDPGPGVALLTDAGECCGSPPWDGDGYIAKYSPTGGFLWAKDLGAETVYDHSCGIAVDPLQNVYVVGEFTGTMILSSTVTFNSVGTGKCYIIKFDRNGNMIWVDNFGLPGYAADDTFPWDIRVTLRSVFICGVLQGTSYFNPAGGSWLTASGYYDGFVAKYDSAGHFVTVKDIAGTGSDNETYNMAIDSLDNIYVTGWTNSATLAFDASSPGTSTVASPGAGSNSDIYFAKYDSNLNYVWGHVVGGTGNDYGRNIEVMGSNVLITGMFSNTVDFDPSPVVANLVSAGGEDIYLAKYDLGGNYICGFRTGSATDDEGWKLSPDNAGNLYACGQFSGSGVDFDPGPGSTLLNSYGGADAYLVKYKWADTSVAGYLVGDTVCAGQPAHITLIITSGTGGPFTITYSDGTTTYTLSGVMGGVPISVGTPGSTTTYHIVSITYAGMSLCSAVAGSSFGTATVYVNPSPVATITATQISCNDYSFSASGGGPSYNWTFGDGSSSAGNPVTHSYTTLGTYTVVVTETNGSGCTGQSSTIVNVSLPPTMTLGPDTTLCTNSPVYVINPTGSYSGSATFTWSNGSTAPTLTVTTSGTYWLLIDDNGCKVRDTIKINLKPQPAVDLGPDISVCPGTAVVLGSPEPKGVTYEWTTGSTDSSITVTDTGTYTLTVDWNGCKASASINITQGQSNPISLGPDTTLCLGDVLVLNINNENALWSTSQHGASIRVDFPGTYWVMVPEPCGYSVDTIQVDFHKCDLGFPTAFTPNGDGKNDVIGVVGTLKYYTDYSLSIYNRWGQRVFYTEDIYQGWNGIFNGTPQDLGTYFYMIYYTLEGKKHMMKGDFQLIR